MAPQGKVREMMRDTLCFIIRLLPRVFGNTYLYSLFAAARFSMLTNAARASAGTLYCHNALYVK